MWYEEEIENEQGPDEEEEEDSSTVCEEEEGGHICGTEKHPRWRFKGEKLKS